MRVVISAYHESRECTWCRKAAEATTVKFEQGFLPEAEFCFRCLQQAIRVQHQQAGGGKSEPTGK